MKKNRCPYCGKRVSYVSAYAIRRKAEYVCPKCGKESKVVIKKRVILVFLLCAVISVGIMLAWIFGNLSANPLGILLVAIPLIVFAIISPKFVEIEPLKKYKKSMEAKKAGIEYSDNLTMSDLDNEPYYSVGKDSDRFQINTDVFNKIRDDRNASREKMSSDVARQSSARVSVENKNTENSQNNRYVHVIDNVSENHSYDDAPLKKLHSDASQSARRTHHYVSEAEQPAEKKQEKQEDNRYSGNRRF